MSVGVGVGVGVGVSVSMGECEGGCRYGFEMNRIPIPTHPDVVIVFQII